MPMADNDNRMIVRVPTALRERLHKRAQENGRPDAAEVRLALENWDEWAADSDWVRRRRGEEHSVPELLPRAEQRRAEIDAIDKATAVARYEREKKAALGIED